MSRTLELTILYVPCSSPEEATTIARNLLEERLIACANFWESRSIYRWNGEIQDGVETLLLVKTAPQRERAVRARITELHSYEVPCIVTLSSAGVNPDYLSWVHGEVFLPSAAASEKQA